MWRNLAFHEIEHNYPNESGGGVRILQIPADFSQNLDP
jgi:hypothetical protein